jgi:hypothetical protein
MFRLYVVIALITVVSLLTVLSSITEEPRVFLFALILVPAVIAGAVSLRASLNSPSRKARSISPESITGQKPREEEAEEAELSPREMSRSIVERAEEIRRTMSESPSEVRIEMCAMGYRTCVNDMVKLTHGINAALQEANFVERVRLRSARRRATDSLSKTRQALPPSALRATRQELQ